MALRDDLKLWIARHVWMTISEMPGDNVPAERWNELFNLLIMQGDNNADTLRDTLDMLYATILSDTDASPHINIEDATFGAGTLKEVFATMRQYIDVRTGAQPNVVFHLGDEPPEDPTGIDVYLDTSKEIL